MQKKEAVNPMGELFWCKQFIGALLDGIPTSEIGTQLCLEESSCQKYINASKKETEEKLLEIVGQINPFVRFARPEAFSEPKTKHPYENIDPEAEEALEQKEVQECAKNASAEEPTPHTPNEPNSVENEPLEEEAPQPQPIVKPSFRDKIKQRKNNKNGTKIISLKKRTVPKTKKEKSVGKKEWKESEKMSFKNSHAKKTP